MPDRYPLPEDDRQTTHFSARRFLANRVCSKRAVHVFNPLASCDPAQDTNTAIKSNARVYFRARLSGDQFEFSFL
jgi:hypothetical protein